ncbi:D-2-hydroxyacid dehydrogenase [Blastomonas aquatica]|uniref:Hydroxyacid dehydrogenase n=1 Tax=Blastomonas aquatica TaxID=1510276 RepID=A0ABQ1JBV9_9SPHN|nr:D-2-hydroxyacid dehydrogenase [Blastomonas aquatica]GGB64942.1 hydroxyacid dehydrogenase [Blastomonas aquatica]
MTKAVISALVRPLLESSIPEGVKVAWIGSTDEAKREVTDADIAWVDMHDKQAMREVMLVGTQLRWVSTLYAGLDHFPVEELTARGTRVTNGVGINTVAVAEYAVLGMLSMAKGYADVVRAADRKEWLWASPGTIELYETRALIIGYGAIGSAIGERLKGFGVEVTGVARTARPDQAILGADEWRSWLGEYDWVVIATPATRETDALIGAAELAAMKPEAILVNIARGECVDQDALMTALKSKGIAGAFLDVTTPEPLPSDHELWTLPNVQISMHLSGRAQTRMFQRSAALFADNLGRYLRGEALVNEVDLALGY